MRFLNRMQNMTDLLENLTKNEPELRQYFLFKCRPEFHRKWIVPDLMTEMLTEP